LVNFGINKNANGINKKLSSFCKALEDNSKSLVQIKDRSIRTKKAMGRIRNLEKTTLVFEIWENATATKTMLVMLPKIYLSGIATKIAARRQIKTEW